VWPQHKTVIILLLHRISSLLTVWSQAETCSLHEAEILHPVVVGEQINEQDGRLNPTVVLNPCLYCGWSAICYMFRLSCDHHQDAFLNRNVSVITRMCLCGLRLQSVHEIIVMRHPSCSGLKNRFPLRTASIQLTSVGASVRILASLRRLLIFQPIETYPFKAYWLIREIIIIIVIIIVIINCNLVVTRWQWSFNTYTKHEIGLLLNLRREGDMRSM
jgi:hypothetical protein